MSNRKFGSENLGGKTIFENAEHKIYFEVETFGRKTSVVWNNKYSDSIHVNPNHVNSNQLITATLTNVISINDSAYI